MPGGVPGGGCCCGNGNRWCPLSEGAAGGELREEGELPVPDSRVVKSARLNARMPISVMMVDSAWPRVSISRMTEVGDMVGR